MSIPKYVNSGPIIATSHFDLNYLKGKSVVITGGANGLGKGYAKALIDAGAFVTIGDVNNALGEQTALELGSNCQFIPCDVRDWDQQVQLFEAAVKDSPRKSCDIVIANAGIWGSGERLANSNDDPSGPPIKPDFTVLDVNQKGVLYTTHLAMHFCRRDGTEGIKGDKSLIIVSSLAGYMDQPGIMQYNLAKCSGRVVMRVLRQDAWKSGLRVNCIAPWLIETDILGAAGWAWWASTGIESALFGDAVKAVLKLATDTTVNGRSLGVVPPSIASEGYIDLDRDDTKEDDFVTRLERESIAAVELRKAKYGK